MAAKALAAEIRRVLSNMDENKASRGDLKDDLQTKSFTTPRKSAISLLFTQSAFCFAQKNARPEQRAPQAFVITGMRKNFGDVTRKNTRHPSPSFWPRPIEASVGGSCVGGSISAPPTSFVLAVSAAKVLCRKTLICEPESSRLGQSDGLRSLRQKRCGHNAEGLLSKAPIPPLVVEWRLLGDTVEKLDFLSRSQFLGQQAGFKKNALRVRQKS
jgi:hypothetical protein